MRQQFVGRGKDASEEDEGEGEAEQETGPKRPASEEAISAFRQECGIEVTLERDAAEAAQLLRLAPVSAFGQLRSLGVAPGLAAASARTAGRGATTAVQAECWGQLLKLRGGGGPPPASSFAAAPVAAAAAAAALELARQSPLPEDVFEEPVESSKGSRCEVAEGRDFVGIAPTGSGKTLAYLMILLADGLCKAQSPAPELRNLFGQFQLLYPRSFEPGKGSNDAILERLRRSFAEEKLDDLRKALRQVSRTAAEGAKEEELKAAWKSFQDNLDTEGLLRPRGLVLAPTRELAMQVGQVAKELGSSIQVVLGGVDHERPGMAWASFWPFVR
ncbi:unnamed protein product [Effrenium voratum]|nr:unnamed protein product [Effrenium voratum]